MKKQSAVMKTAKEIISDWVIENSGLQDNPLTRSASSRAADNLYSHLRESSHLCEWISVQDRMPPTGQTVAVVIGGLNALGQERKYRHYAQWVDRYTVVDYDNYLGDAEYNEDKDEYYWPEGWYEKHYEGEETCWQITDPVTHWMPLPKPPQ